VRHRAKFCANRSNRYRDMTIFQFLDLFYGCLGHPRSVFGGLCHCAKFGWNRFSSFDNMLVLFVR